MSNELKSRVSNKICSRIYGEYKIPKHLKGLIAKYYLVDSCTDENSKDYQDSVSFENYLNRNTCVSCLTTWEGYDYLVK